MNRQSHCSKPVVSTTFQKRRGGNTGRRSGFKLYCNSGTCRSGFALVELLIVIGIIVLLLQLSLPAVEASREAARKTACANSLRQIGLAMANHEGSLGYLPTGGWGWGWVGDPDRGVGKNQPGSWAYQLLPYLEQGTLHEIGSGVDVEEKVDAITKLASTPAPLLSCPSRRLPKPTLNVGPVLDVEGVPAGFFWFNAKKAEKLARSDYVANVGDRWVYWHEGPSPEEAAKGEGFGEFADIDIDPSITLSDVTGVVVQRTPLSLRQIQDGISKTYFAGEKHMLQEAYKVGWQLNDDQSCWNGDDLDTVATTELQPMRDFSLDEEKRIRVEAPFGSAHPEGLNMLLCDGSVQPISYAIDQAVHRRYGNRRDSEVAQALSP